MRTVSPDSVSIAEFVKNGADFKEGFSNFSGPGIEIKNESTAVPVQASQKTAFSDRFTLTNAQKLRMGIGGLGSVAGILVAIHRKSGFWGGVGWWIVGGMVGGAIGWIATSGMDEEKK